MTTRLQLNVDDLDTVDEAHRDFYEPDPDQPGGFRLALDKDALRSTFKRERDLRKAAENRQRELETQVADLRGLPRPVDLSTLSPRDRWIHEQARRLAPFEPGSSEWREEFARIESEMQPLVDAEIAQARSKGEEELKTLAGEVARLVRANAAEDFLREITNDPESVAILKPFALERFGAEQRGQEWVATIVDEDGKPSTGTLEGLKHEFRSNPAFSRLVRGVSPQELAAHAQRVKASTTPHAGH